MWSTESEQAFRILKTALTSSPVLHTQDFSCPFILHMDASGTRIGVVLSQIQEGKEHPVVYISRKLSPAETRYGEYPEGRSASPWKRFSCTNRQLKKAERNGQ